MTLFDAFKRKKRQKFCSAIIVAAGNAKRMQGIDKIWADLRGKHLIQYTIEAFESSPEIDEIILVVRKEDVQKFSSLCEVEHYKKISKVISGGTERVLSVYCGVQEVSKKADLIAVQDGARPFVSEKIIRDTVAAARKFGAAAPAVPVKDTIKKIKADDTVIGTEERNTLRAVQTPQIFDSDLFRASIEKVKEQKIPVTDDCSVVEQIRYPVHLVNGSEKNIKVTTPFDLKIAEMILGENS